MPYLTLLAALAFALSPLVTGGFGGFDPGDFPIPQRDPPVQPAGWAFSIWGVVYLGLVIHAGVSATVRRRAPGWRAMRAPLTLSLAVGAVWIPVARVSPVWATVLIWVMLAGALAAFLRAPNRDRLLARVPLGLYTGWLLAASCVSLGILAAGFGLAGPIAAAAGALTLAILLALALLRRRRSVAVSAALVWAFAGTVAQNLDGSVLVLCLALAGAAAVAVATLLPRVLKRGLT